MAEEEKKEEQQEEQAEAPKPAPPPPPAPPKKPVQMPDFGGMQGLLGITVDTAKPLLLIGVVLVLLARGCDSLGQRGVAAKQAKLQLAQSEFKYDWESDEIDIQQDIREIEEDIQAEKDEEDPDKKAIEGYEEDLKEKRKEQKELAEEKAKATQEFQEDDLRALQKSASDARAANAKGGWWREFFFILGTLVLVVAVTAIGFQSTGPERVVALIILSIIAFSIYIGGLAWASAAMAVLQ